MLYPQQPPLKKQQAKQQLRQAHHTAAPVRAVRAQQVLPMSLQLKQQHRDLQIPVQEQGILHP